MLKRFILTKGSKGTHIYTDANRIFHGALLVNWIKGWSIRTCLWCWPRTTISVLYFLGIQTHSVTGSRKANNKNPHQTGNRSLARRYSCTSASVCLLEPHGGQNKIKYQFLCSLLNKIRGNDESNPACSNRCQWTETISVGLVLTWIGCSFV